MKKILATLAILSLGISSPTQADNINDWIEYQVGDLSLMLPSDEKWQVTEESEALKFGRAEYMPSGSRKLIQYLIVTPNPYPEAFDDWIAEEIAMAYREWEVSNMQDPDAEGSDFTLLEVELGEEVHGDYTLYYLKNLKDARDIPETSWTLEQQELYLVFLPDYAEKRTFYKLFFGAVCINPSCDIDDLSLDALKPTLDHLKM
jgi:hypothetical protein